jgi:LPXTG-motif cell wall-anchored protein
MCNETTPFLFIVIIIIILFFIFYFLKKKKNWNSVVSLSLKQRHFG